VSTGPALVRLSLNRQRSFSIEARVRHRDGHWISVRASTLPVTDIAHRLSGVALILSPLEPPSAALTPLKDLRLLDLLYRYHRSNLTSEHSPTRT
jgi:PAS domain-containing protein